MFKSKASEKDQSAATNVADVVEKTVQQQDFVEQPARRREPTADAVTRSFAMRWHTSSASSSSADIVADLFRLIPPNERTAFREMLEHELRGRELPGGELRRVAERAWHRFLRYGWPKHGPGDVA